VPWARKPEVTPGFNVVQRFGASSECSGVDVQLLGQGDDMPIQVKGGPAA